MWQSQNSHNFIRSQCWYCLLLFMLMHLIRMEMVNLYAIYSPNSQVFTWICRCGAHSLPLFPPLSKKLTEPESWMNFNGFLNWEISTQCALFIIARCESHHELREVSNWFSFTKLKITFIFSLNFIRNQEKYALIYQRFCWYDMYFLFFSFLCIFFCVFSLVIFIYFTVKNKH